jgi:hypothetical protein
MRQALSVKEAPLWIAASKHQWLLPVNHAPYNGAECTTYRRIWEAAHLTFFSTLLGPVPARVPSNAEVVAERESEGIVM